MTSWKTFFYYQKYDQIFTPRECDRIIHYHTNMNVQNSVMENVRNSDLFWLYQTDENSWMFDKLASKLEEFNKDYQFDVKYERLTAQLTRYKARQHYDWHMDLGPGQASRRKLSIVVELTPLNGCTGGGLEIFYTDKIENRIPLKRGDAVVFPSYIMHKAVPVEAGTRWSLVSWLLGDDHLK